MHHLQRLDPDCRSGSVGLQSRPMSHLSTASTFGSLSVRTPRVGPGMRVGVMGGTFNPPHEGHLMVARTALKRLRLDALWWLVTPGNPLKSNGGLPPVDVRMAACRALARDRRMKVTAFERELGARYTAITLGFLRRRHPSVRFFWVMGADNLASFHRWQNWRGIARSMPLVVVDRPGWRFKAVASPAARAMSRRRWREHHALGLSNFIRPKRAKAADVGAFRASSAHGAGQGWVLLSTRLSPESSTVLRQSYRNAGSGKVG